MLFVLFVLLELSVFSDFLLLFMIGRTFVGLSDLFLLSKLNFEFLLDSFLSINFALLTFGFNAFLI